jgi:hypothetical protein
VVAAATALGAVAAPLPSPTRSSRKKGVGRAVEAVAVALGSAACIGNDNSARDKSSGGFLFSLSLLHGYDDLQGRIRRRHRRGQCHDDDFNFLLMC